MNSLSEETLFANTVALPASERPAYLERACAGDAALRARVEALVQAHLAAGSFLDAPPTGVAAAVPPAAPTEAPGDCIGPYKLLQKIGEGGCGTVYMAEQEEPVRRRVALKVIKLGMDTKEVVARFEAERQALALMDHPNIARVLDAGATDAGRPYFVMELVRGIPITKYCDEYNLATADRIALFIQVCHAVQHAHQKGIIHRDIKPSNILVTINDGVPVPKVIDFGIAKATTGRLTDRTLFTAFEQFIGTPAYMSPEQAQLSSLDVDTRSDIYSLGVLLYELLTGRTPFETKELLQAGLDEIRRRIREVEPPKPSTRLSTLGSEALATTAHHRCTEPPRLLHLVRGDLDWIVMRCLEKNRSRRYETANELAADLARHLHDEPVSARPPSAFYRLQKLVRRNRLAFAAASAIAAALVVGLAVSSWMYSREKVARERAVAAEEQQRQFREQADAARVRAVYAETEQSRLRQQAEAARNDEARQRTSAEEARNNETHQRELAEADRKTAETEASKSRQVAQFLADMLSGVGPEVALGRDTKLLREILDKTAGRVGQDFKEQPAVEAQLRATLGRVYDQLGEYGKAEPMLREALAMQRKLVGNEDPSVAALLGSLAQTLFLRGDLANAEAMEREALAMQRKLLGGEHPTVAISLSDLGKILAARGDFAGAESAHREALAMQRKLLGNDLPALSTSLHNLAQTLMKRGDLAGAEAAVREALAMQRKLLGNEHPAVATSLDSLASVLLVRGDLAGAEAMDREALAMQRKLLGNEHPELAVTLHNLSSIRSQRGDLAGAEAMLREALAMQRKLLGNEHPAVASSLDSLGMLLLRRGDPAGAESTMREGLAMQRKLLGSEHPDVALSLNNLALILARRGDFAGAETMDREALAMLRKLLGNEHPAVATALNNLAAALQVRGDLAAAEPLFREALAMQRKLLGNEHPEVALSLNNLAAVLARRGDFIGAEAMLREALAIQRKLLGNEHPDVARSLNNLASVLLQRGDPAAAEPLFREALAMQRKLLGNEHPDVAVSLQNRAQFLAQRGDLADAERLHREALAIQRKLLGNEHPDVATSLCNLTQVLLRRGDKDGAEAEAREALNMRRKLFGNEHPDIVEPLAILATVLWVRGDFSGAGAAVSEAVALKHKLHTHDDPDFAALLCLSGDLARRGHDWGGAETQLLEAWKILETTSARVDPKLRLTAAELLAQLYEDWSRKEPTKAAAAAEWKKRSQQVGKEQATQGTSLQTAANPPTNPYAHYANTKTADSATLRTRPSRPSSGERVLGPQVVKIDGVFSASPKHFLPLAANITLNAFKIKQGYDPFEFYVAPGKRWLQIRVTESRWSYHITAEENVEIEFASGKIFNLTAKKAGDDFDVMLWDETQGIDKPALLKTWRLKGNRVDFSKHQPD
jgi:eukaryotic-like serine/threonine-protein kinase